MGVNCRRDAENLKRDEELKSREELLKRREIYRHLSNAADHVEVSGGDTWYRVRVGPLATQEQVQAMRSQLTAAGLEVSCFEHGRAAENADARQAGTR